MGAHGSKERLYRSASEKYPDKYQDKLQAKLQLQTKDKKYKPSLNRERFGTFGVRGTLKAVYRLHFVFACSFPISCVFVLCMGINRCFVGDWSLCVQSSGWEKMWSTASVGCLLIFGRCRLLCGLVFGFEMKLFLIKFIAHPTVFVWKYLINKLILYVMNLSRFSLWIKFEWKCIQCVRQEVTLRTIRSRSPWGWTAMH